MTTVNELNSEKKFVPVLLPWVIAAGAIGVYLLTLNRWLSLGGVPNVAMVAGWDWRPELNRPLYWLVTLPAHLLPEGMIPLAMNVFSAVCAALTLALLARSVAILPHDRTEEQRLRERSPYSTLSIRSAWLPPVLAALLCGLQITYWEQATTASSDIFDLLLFAYIVRCLLEFRLNGTDSWLLKASFVYGAAMTGNWAMVAFFPLFLVALIWFKGVSFFNLRFLRQMFVLGTIGLSFYLLLPIVHSISGDSSTGFWPNLKSNLSTQKTLVWNLVVSRQMLFQGEHPLWVLALPSLLPILAMSFRWPSYFGDPSKLGVALATWVFNFLHALLLAICAWVALDPQFSPRNYFPELAQFGITMLPLYLLAALSVGYYSGYFLLVFGGAKPALKFPRPEPGIVKVLNVGVTALIWLLFAIVPVMLVYNNLPQMRLTNGPMLRSYTELLAQPLPKRAVVLSDDPVNLLLLKFLTTQTSPSQDLLLLHTDGLNYPEYHQFIARKYPNSLPAKPARVENDKVPNGVLLSLIAKFGETRPVCYLHPSFGYYFEHFYPEPLGLSFQLSPYPTNLLFRPALSKEVISKNQSFWKNVETTHLQPLQTALTAARGEKSSSPLAAVAKRLHLVRRLSNDSEFLSMFYSRGLTSWGVSLRRNGLNNEAEACFQRALDLNPDNLTADINLLYSRNASAGDRRPIPFNQTFKDKYQKFNNNIEFAMNKCGPFDEPGACFGLATVFYDGNNRRQAAEEYRRASELLPEKLEAAIATADAALMVGYTAPALKIVDDIHARGEAIGLCQTNYPMLLRIESAAHLMNGDLERAEQAVQAALGKYPDDPAVLTMATRVLLEGGYPSNALKIIEQHLKFRPDDRNVLIDEGVAWLRCEIYTNAIASLTRAIRLGTNGTKESLASYHTAMLNRAVCHQKAEHLNEAQKDYEELQAAYPRDGRLAYLLAEVADGKHDTNAAIRNYQIYLSTSPSTNAPATSNALVRLKDLRRVPR